MPSLVLGAALALVSTSAWAGPSDVNGGKGLGLARRGDCVKAVPLLEDAELGRHRPATAVALADCYARVGELILSSELYHAVVEDKPARSWKRDDYNAWKAAKGRAEVVDARIPTIELVISEEYEDLEIEINEHKVTDLKTPLQVLPDVSIPIVARAKGRKEFTDKLVLSERERRKVVIQLESGATAAKKPGGAGPAASAAPAGPTWLGARFQGVIIPQFLFGTFADGGRSTFVPGVGFTLTTPVSDVELVISLSYLNYSMADTPFKPSGGLDTDWEFVSSSLQALTASASLRWSIPLDAQGAWTLKLGGGVGVGWTFLGDIHRTQAFPANGKPGDPYTYMKCKGPNNPRGTFAYCNTLDKDATHYGDYAEPNWFQHGLRPLIFPWLVLPEIGLSWKVAPKVAIDLGLGTSLSGIVTDLGFRLAL